MRLSARAIVTWAQVNIFDYDPQWKIRAGETNTLIFQVIDLDQDRLRYMIGAPTNLQPASVSVTFPSIDDCNVLTLAAYQMDPNDKSIWAVTLSTAQTPASGNVLFQINENGTIRNFRVNNMLQVERIHAGSC